MIYPTKFYVIILVISVFCAKINSEIPDSFSVLSASSVYKIIGRHPANRSAWPFIAVVAHGPIVKCGGSLIRRNWVLTAAHCLDPEIHKDMALLQLQPGVGLAVDELTLNYTANLFKPKKEYKIVNITVTILDNVIPSDLYILHPKYLTKTDNVYQSTENDIALMKLRYPVKLSDKIQLAPLSKVPVKPSTKCVAAGWGQRKINLNEGTVDESYFFAKNILHEAYLQVVDVSECAFMMNLLLLKDNISFLRDMSKDMNPILYDKICTRSGIDGEAVSKGDSGGPLVCDGMLQGIANVLLGMKFGNLFKLYSLFTHIDVHADWINETLFKYAPSHIYIPDEKNVFRTAANSNISSSGIFSANSSFYTLLLIVLEHFCTLYST